MRLMISRHLRPLNFERIHNPWHIKERQPKSVEQKFLETPAISSDRPGSSFERIARLHDLTVNQHLAWQKRYGGTPVATSPAFFPIEVLTDEENGSENSVPEAFEERSATLLEPLAEAIGRHVKAGQAIFADDTIAQMQAPETGKTRTGCFWTYVRDERPWAGDDCSAVYYRYTPDRGGKSAAIACTLIEGSQA